MDGGKQDWAPAKAARKIAAPLPGDSRPARRNPTALQATLEAGYFSCNTTLVPFANRLAVRGTGYPLLSFRS